MDFSQWRWGRIVVAGLLAIILAYVAVFLVVAGYGVKLGFEARGAPDQDKIEAFARQAGPRLGTPLVLLFTLGGAWWATRRAGAAAFAQGVAVALLAVGVALVLSRSLTLAAAAEYLGMLVAGGVGGWLGGRGGGGEPPPVR